MRMIFVTAATFFVAVMATVASAAETAVEQCIERHGLYVEQVPAPCSAFYVAPPAHEPKGLYRISATTQERLAAACKQQYGTTGLSSFPPTHCATFYFPETTPSERVNIGYQYR